MRFVFVVGGADRAQTVPVQDATAMPTLCFPFLSRFLNPLGDFRPLSALCFSPLFFDLFSPFAFLGYYTL